MGPGDFQRVARLFDELRGQDELERRRVLATLPSEIRRELTVLLDRHAADEAAIEDPLLAAGASLRLEVADQGASSPPQGERIDVPAQVGRYPIVGEIARGGIGVVYRAQDLGIGRDVAVKVLRPEFRTDRGMAERLEHEGRIGGRLQHPGIVPVHDVVTTGPDAPFLVMRVVEGRTLAELLAESHRALDPGQHRLSLLAIFEKVCQAIGYSHARGVVHRDLKPSNLMVGEFGEVQVMDWGVALEIGQPGEVRALGTPAYMAPEQARGDATALRPELDVFGLGGILSEILCGAPPFDGRGTGTVLEQARSADVGPAVSRLEACDVDGELVELAVHCLAADPEQRPSDATTVARRMRDYLDGFERRARRAELDAASARARAASEVRVRRLTVALGASLVLATVIGAFLWLQDEFAERGREREATRRLARAVLDAESIAAAATASVPNEVAQWEGAALAARTASELSVGVDDPGLVDRAANLHAAIERRLRGLRLVRRLEDLARQHEAFTGLWHGSSTPGMRLATAEYLGAELMAIGADRAAHQLAEIEYPRELIRALDAWIAAESRLDADSDICAAVVATVNVLDPDVWRRRVRIGVQEQDRAALVALAGEMDPATADGFAASNLAVALAAQGESQLALRTLRRVHQASPGDYDVNLGLAMLYGEAANPYQFVRFASVCVAQQPEQPFARGLLALALFRAARIAESLAIAERALEQNEDNQLAHLALLLGSFEAGDYDRSREHARVIEESAEDSHAMFPELAGYVAASYRHAGDMNRCRHWLLRALHSPRMTASGFSVFPRVRNLPELLDFLRQRSREGDPWDAYVVGRILIEQGEWLEAVPWLERAQAASPDLPFLDHHLAEVRRALGGGALSYGAVDASLAALEAGLSRADARAVILGRFDGATEAPPPNLVAYIEARLAERDGHLSAAIEGYLVVMAADPNAAAPWLHWHRLREARDGAVVASRELGAAISRLGPESVLPILPGPPLAASPVNDSVGRGVSLQAVAPEVQGDPRHPHARTLWQVRRLPHGSFELDPVVDLLGPPDLELRLPDGLLERGARYAWRVAFVIHRDVSTPWSEEATFVVGPDGPTALPIDLAPFATDDVIVNSGDSENDLFDSLNGFSLVASGFSGQDGAADPTVRGLPFDGQLGVHRLGGLDDPNAVRLAPRTEDLRIPLPPGDYCAVRLLVSGANGNATLGVSVIYEDGVGPRRRCVVPDWFSADRCQSFERNSIGTPRWRGMDRYHSDGVEERNAAIVFEDIVPVDPARRAVAIHFSSSTASLGDANTEPFLFAVTAMKN